jgi:hypothetical protein
VVKVEHVKRWEVWNRTYDTFGENEAHLENSFTSEEVARELARLLNKGWGNRAYVEPVLAEPEVEDLTLKQFKRKYAHLYKIYREV